MLAGSQYADTGWHCYFRPFVSFAILSILSFIPIFESIEEEEVVRSREGTYEYDHT